MRRILQCLKLFSLLLLVSSYSKAECLPDVTGLCTPGVTITEEEDILVTEASLAKEHGGDGEKHSPMKRDDDEKKKKKKKVLVDDDDKKNENWTRGNKNDLLFERLTKMWTK